MRRAFTSFHPGRLRAGAALLGLLGALFTTIAVAGPASADEVYQRPASGVFSVEGHGWGHGHGLSQWGAQGAASLGVDADTITATYYPGTARTVLPDAPIRVLLQADEGRDTQVFAATGLAVTDLASGRTEVLPAGPTRWRATVDSAGLHLSSLTGSTWTPYAIGGSTAGSPPANPNQAYSGPLRFAGPPFVRVAFPDGTSRDYRGAVQAVQTGASSLQTIDVLSLEDYLLGVVPRESPSSWLPAALQAQAIAARSYSAYKRAHAPAGSTYDICDSTQCQVFGGSRVYAADGSSISLEPASTTDAVRATAGVVRTYGGQPIFAEYSSSNGGWSTDGGQPYLVAQRDDWDGAVQNSVHSWTASLPASDIERSYPAVGTLQRIRVTARDGNGEWGGRVRSVVLEGVSSTGAPTSVNATGVGVYLAHSWPGNSDGLRSSWWHITTSTDGAVVSQSAAPNLVRAPGASTGQLTVTMRNTGTTAWPTAGLHMAVASPPGQPDPLVGGSAQPGVLVPTGAGSIPTGGTASFTFALDASSAMAGRYGRAYRLQIGAGPLFGGTVNWTIPVAPALFKAAAVGTPTSVGGAGGAGPPAVLGDGRTIVLPRNGTTTLRLLAVNTGNVSWPAGASTPIQLGTSGPRSRTSGSAGPSWLSPSRAARLTATSDVPPGAVGAFDLTLYGAGRPVGQSWEAFEPLWEYKHWLDGAVTTLSVIRVDPAISRLAVTALGPPTVVRTGGTVTLVVRLRNLGGSPWTVGKEWLAASSGRPDPLRTSAWPYPTRPPALAANVSRPGSPTVYPGEAGEWRIPLSGLGRPAGTYAEAWQPIGPTGRYGPVLRTSFTVLPR